MNDGIIEARIDCLNQVESIMFHLNEIVKNIEGLNEKNFEAVANNLINASINVRDAQGLIEKGNEQ